MTAMDGERVYAYYPGCSLHATAKEYDLSARAVCSALGVVLREVPDWNCCGASSAHARDHLLGVALAARNLALVEEMGMREVAVPCAACYNRLAVAGRELQDDGSLAAEVREMLGRPLEGSAKARALLDVVVRDVGAERIRDAVKRPLEGLKVACYYGCLLVRPPRALGTEERVEDPQSLDELVRALGGEPVEWPHKTECCGAGLSLARTDVVRTLSANILKMARDCGAGCVVCACPLCMTNLDMRQAESLKAAGEDFSMPVLYFTELMGLAMGLPGAERWLKMHFVDASAVTRREAAAVRQEEPC
jgi:heterodisulfide reductase subunit B